MSIFQRLRWTLLTSGVAAALIATVAVPSAVSARQQAPTAQERQAMIDRIAVLEARLSELATAKGEPVAAAAQAGAQQNPPMTMPMPAGAAGGDAANPEGLPQDSTNPQDMLNRMKLLEQRVRDLESSTVLSDPETRVKKIEVYVDQNGNIFDNPVPGAKKTVTYQRERVYRRQTINEKIEEALASAEENNVKVGVDAGIVAQLGHRTKGAVGIPNHHAYELASADLYFTAGVAQHTIFFADIVGLSGPPPDMEIPTLTLINGYSARLVNQNELNLREAWLSTELFSQRLSITAGRLDLTNYFDHNAAANDETSQFVSDALVNNPMLGLSNNGAGVSLVLDPKNGLNFKLGLQQSNTNALSLSDSIFSLAEIGYGPTLPGLGEGNYRFWYRVNNGNAVPGYRTGFGVSLDQRLSPSVKLFARYGNAQADVKRDHFYSTGLQFSNGLGFYPGDVWGVGYAQTDPQYMDVDTDPDGGRKERMAEFYYSLGLSERLKLSFHAQHFLELMTGNTRTGFFVPGVRLQASF